VANYYNTFACWAEAFLIFQKYDPHFAHVAAEHDIIYAGGNTKEFDPEDVFRLETLGWHLDKSLNTFYHYV